MKRMGMARGLIAVMAAVTLAGACTSTPSPGASGGANAKYTIGFTNPGGVGNGWREAMLCSAKVQAVKAGNVTKVTIIHRDTDAPGQLADIRTLIAQGVNAIIINPAGPDALNPAIKEATDAGITVVSVDASVTAPGAYNLSNDQEQYAYLGATWLFKAMGDKGAVVYMRGIAGHPADTDRDTGFQRALKEHPGITIAATTVTKWDPATATTQINDVMSAGTKFDGIWTSGVDSNIVDALKAANHAYVPIVGADNAGFVNQLLAADGPKGAAVTNPASIGGAGVTLALQILGGKKPAATTVHVTPELWANDDAAGKASLTAAADKSLPKTWPLGLTIKDWTTYSKAELIACKGPGDA
ncbi:MAG TPA: substrate-binding domain-containing protein [Candidatus Limnocylindrales bacterium]|nr:substrate-binding domain-containing protein [Candidatus Limnocylindrales bacterium]